MLKNKILRKVLAVSLASVMLCGTGFTTVGQFVGTSGITVNADSISKKTYKYQVHGVNKARLTGYLGSEKNVVLPEKINNKTLDQIAGYAFSGCTSVESITIPYTVQSIVSGAFYNCPNLTSIIVDENNVYYSSEDGVLFNKDKTVLVAYPYGKTGEYIIPDSVTSIGDGAFNGCTGLTSITIPDSMTFIGDGTFNGCTGLTSINIPNSVTFIGGSAFYGCTGLTSITIPDNVTSIDYGAFNGCTSLTSINISENHPIYSSDDGVLFSKDKTEIILYPQGRNGTYTIPDSVTSIGYGAFYGCTGLTSITIPDNVTSIGYGAFNGCTNLTDINLGKGIQSIGTDSFFDTAWYYNQPDGIICVGTYLYGYKGTPESELTIPDGVTIIGDYVFMGCIWLTNITIPDSVTTIGFAAFESCTGLASIVLPNSVTSIRDYAFWGCTGLTSVVIPNSMTKLNDNSLDYLESYNLTVYGRKGSDADKYLYNYGGMSFVELTNYFEGTAQTCTEPGKKDYYHNNFDGKDYEDYDCKKVITDLENWIIIPATGHNYKETVIAPTCTKKGYTLHTCKNCGDKYKDTYVNATGHSYKEEVTAPTCTEQGYTTHTCSVCGDSYTDTYTEPTGHSYKEEITAPICTEQGYTTHTCSACGDSYTDNYTEPTGHNYELADEAIPTCTENGKKVYKCSICGDTKTEVVNATGHHYIATVIAPTCTEQGYTIHTCENCGDSYKDTYTNAAGHKFELIKETAPTCTEAGEEIYECTECGYTRTNVIEATGHHYKKEVIVPTTEEEGYTLHTCKDCGHSYKDTYTAKLLANRSTLSNETIVIGKQITVNATATGGAGEYQYQVVYKQKTQTKWTTVQKYSSNATVTFKPAKATDYDVCVKVKDSDGTEIKKFFEVKVNAKLANASSLSAENIVVGQKVTANCLATGGLGDYQYQVVYKQTSQTKWTTAQAFSENAEVTFKPAKATDYDVCIKVKDADGTIVKKFFTVKVNEKLTNTSDISSTEIKKGGTVTVNGSATGGMGNYTYAVFYKQKAQTKWTVKQDFDANSIVSVKPAKATDYDICVKVKDKDGTISKKYFAVNVTE